jgi:hypothetical protein
MRALADLIRANPREALFLVLIGALGGWLTTIALDHYAVRERVAFVEAKIESVARNQASIDTMLDRLRQLEIDFAVVEDRVGGRVSTRPE